MIDRPVCCFRCGMWEFLETPRLPEVHICARCEELQLLRDRIRELELRLDDLRLVREKEALIEMSYRQIVTPRSLCSSTLPRVLPLALYSIALLLFPK